MSHTLGPRIAAPVRGEEVTSPVRFSGTLGNFDPGFDYWLAVRRGAHLDLAPTYLAPRYTPDSFSEWEQTLDLPGAGPVNVVLLAIPVGDRGELRGAALEGQPSSRWQVRAEVRVNVRKPRPLLRTR
jgi:hypothetical protein